MDEPIFPVLNHLGNLNWLMGHLIDLIEPRTTNRAQFSPQHRASLLYHSVEFLTVSEAAAPTDGCKENCTCNNRLVEDMQHLHLAAHIKEPKLSQEVAGF